MGWTIVKGYSLKQVSSTWKRHRNSLSKTNREKSTEAVPVWLHQALTGYIRKAKKLALEMALSKYEAKKAAEDAASEEESKCLAAEAAGEGEK